MPDRVILCGSSYNNERILWTGGVIIATAKQLLLYPLSWQNKIPELWVGDRNGGKQTINYRRKSAPSEHSQ